MSVNISQKRSLNHEKIWYIWSGVKHRSTIATGIFTYAKPLNQLQRNHNKETLIIIETKTSQMILEGQAINSGYILQHKVKHNFLDYYAKFVKLNARKGNRHLQNGLNEFRTYSHGLYSPH